MGTTNRVYLINKTWSEDTRPFATLKAMCEIFNKEFKNNGNKGTILTDLLFNHNALMSFNWDYPQKYKGYTIRRKLIERN